MTSSIIRWPCAAATAFAALLALGGCFPDVPVGTRDALKDRLQPAPPAPARSAPVEDGAVAARSPSRDAAAPTTDLVAERVTDLATDLGSGPDGASDLATTAAMQPPRDGAIAVSEVTPPPASSPLPDVRAPTVGEIVITELLINPAGTDLGREWIELGSLAPVTLDLSELHVADQRRDAPAPAGVLAPGASVAVGQSTDRAKNGGAPIDVGFGTSVSLNNDGDTITLCLGPCASGLVLDQYTYGALGPAYDGHALALPSRADAARTGCAAQEPFGTEGSYGTPGSSNPPCAP